MRSWALDFFPKDTLRIIGYKSESLDITKARENYLYNYKPTEFASFTAFNLELIKAMDEHPWSRTRKVNGEWYCFDNLPLFFPTAVGGSKGSLSHVFNSVESEWVDFWKNWKAISGENPNKLDHGLWSLSHFIGNLPNLDFTAFTLHKGVDDTARPFFYFGQRTENDGTYTIPLSINFDHANSDPFVINQLMETFKELITS